MLNEITNLYKATSKHLLPSGMWWLKVLGHFFIALMAALVIEILKEQGILKILLPFIF